MTDESVRAVRQQLDTMLSGAAFGRSPRSSQLLRFLVENTLAGQQELLKEYSIATMAFGRPESFDPRVDSLVRVQAARLRSLLEGYYLAEGEKDPVEISLPAGAYVPVFRDRVTGRPVGAAGGEEPAEVVALSGRKRRTTWLLFAAAGVVLAVIIAGGWRLADAERKPGAAAGVDLWLKLSVPGEVILSPVAAADFTDIYYASTRGGDRLRIWRQQPKGGAAQALTAADADSFDLDLSADGSLLAYWSTRNGGGIHIQPARGGTEEFLVPYGRSPRFSERGDRIAFWTEEPHTSFGKAFTKALPGPSEPVPIATEFQDAHNPQWTPDGKILLCGTQRTNVASLEHDFWIVPATGVAAPVKTGVLPQLLRLGIDPHQRPFRATSFRWHGSDLIVAARHGERTRLYRLPLAPGTWQLAGEVRPLDESAESQDQPWVRGPLLAYATAEARLGIWAIPLGGDGLARGEPKRLTQEPGDQFLPATSLDGRKLVFLAGRPQQQGVWYQDLESGISAEIFRPTGVNRLVLDPSGTTAFCRVMAGPSPQRQEIHAIDLTSRQSRRVCADCGWPTSSSPRGEYVVHQTGSAVPRLAVLRVATGERLEILDHPHHALQAGRVSPDGSWIAFEMDRGRDGTRLYLAPFRGLAPIPAVEWVAVSPDDGASRFQPAWSPDGSALYFLSAGGNSRDLWMQPIKPAGVALGGPRLVYRFPSSKLTPLAYHWRAPFHAGLSVGGGHAVLALSELTSSVWLGRFR